MVGGACTASTHSSSEGVSSWADSCPMFSDVLSPVMQKAMSRPMDRGAYTPGGARSQPFAGLADVSMPGDGEDKSHMSGVATECTHAGLSASTAPASVTTRAPMPVPARAPSPAPSFAPNPPAKECAIWHLIVPLTVERTSEILHLSLYECCATFCN